MEKMIAVSDIVWDTDGENPEEMGLPMETVIPVSELLYDDESLDDVDLYDVADRAVDYLSDQYGFCIESLAMGALIGQESMVI